MKKALLIVDECPIEGKSGSAIIYREWLESLKNIYEDIYIFVFSNAHGKEIEYEKKSGCEIYYFNKISNKIHWKIIRLLGQITTRSLVIPKWAYKGNYAPEQKIREILERIKPNIIVYNKYYTLDLLGNEDWIRSEKIIKVMDIHDDFIEREYLEREFIKKTKADIFTYRLSALKQVLTPWDKKKSENDIDAIYKKMDYLCIASDSEFEKLKGKGHVKKIYWQSTLENRSQLIESNASQTEYDIGIIGSDAYFNIEGIQWFLDRVYKKLIKEKPEIRILIAGKCVEYFKKEQYNGIDFVSKIDDINDFYSKIRLAAIPVIHGTGVSVKTLEAIAYRTPFVSTKAGARGLPITINNKYITDDSEVYLKNIIYILENYEEAIIYFKKISKEISLNLKKNSIINFLKEIK